uniref:Uncharacterized protein n=1 Tax=Chenopodium quinoa TaxID=63459 RepID=A0A803MSE9_CHEQI
MMDNLAPATPDADSNSTVDASRPFHSVKEAVAIFGKRILLREVQSPSQAPSTPPIEQVTLSPSLEFTPSSEKSHGVALEIGTPDSYEFTQSPYKPQSNATSEAIDSPVCEPTPSPEIPNNENKLYPCSSFPWDKSISPSPSTSSKEIEPALSSEKPTNDKQGKIVHGNDLVMMLMILKRLESELQETKTEVKLLKERESETEVALASLNAELHENMSKIAKAEAAEAGKAAAKSLSVVEEGNREIGMKDEETRKFEVMVKNVDSPTLAQILSITDYDCYFGDVTSLLHPLFKF